MSGLKGVPKRDVQIYREYYEYQLEWMRLNERKALGTLVSTQGRFPMDDDFCALLPWQAVFYRVKFLLCWLARRYYNYRVFGSWPNLVHIYEVHSHQDGYGWSIHTVAVGRGVFSNWFIKHYSDGDSFY